MSLFVLGMSEEKEPVLPKGWPIFQRIASGSRRLDSKMVRVVKKRIVSSKLADFSTDRIGFKASGFQDGSGRQEENREKNEPVLPKGWPILQRFGSSRELS